MSKHTTQYVPKGQVHLVDYYVYITGKKHFKVDEKINNRNARLHYYAEINDISKSEKDVLLYISFSFDGSRRRDSFCLSDTFSRRITLFPDADGNYPKKEDYDFQATLEMLPKAFDIVNEQLDNNKLTSHKDAFDRQMTDVLTYDLANAFKRWHEDEKNGFLGMEEMSAEEAIEYLPTVFTYVSCPELTKDDYREILEDAHRVFLCEVSPEGYAEEIIRRMRYAIDSLGYDSKEVFYYAEVGKKSDGVLTPDCSSIMNDMERHFNVVKHIWGADPNGETRYTKAYVGLIVRR